MTIPSPLELTFETIDLCQGGPDGIGIEHFAGGDNASFDPSMSLVHFLSGEEIGLDFAEAGLGYSGVNKAWMFLYNCGWFSFTGNT